MKKFSILFSTLLFSTSVLANDNYKYCEFWGIAGGNDDSFMQTLAGRLIVKQGIKVNDSVCNSVKRDAYRFASELSTGKLSDKESFQRWKKYQDFRDKVFDKLVEIID